MEKAGQRQKIAISLLRFFGRIFERFLTRTTMTGLENVPHDISPLIFAANHASTYDPIAMLMHVPVDVRLIGPGDFKLLFPGDLIVKALGVVLIQRGKADRDSLKKMKGILDNGENLSLFADGGTWEKRLDDVKPGAAYLSNVTGARIVPVSLSGTYQVWSKIFRLQRPRINIHFEPPMPIVEIADRKQRQEILRNASLQLMNIIYAHLDPAEQARYDLHAHQQFSGKVEFLPAAPDILIESEFPILAELVSKPNLFSPLHRNLQLPLKPFVETHRFYAVSEFEASLGVLLNALPTGLEDYLDYRLGSTKAQNIAAELTHLRDLAEQAATRNLAMRFTPEYRIVEEALPPNT